MMNLRNACLACVALLTLAPARLQALPAIFWASDPVAPGDQALVIGDSLGPNGSATLTRLADNGGALDQFDVSQHPLALEQADATSFKFKLPADVSSGVFMLTVSSGGHATSILLNAPSIYWAQGDLGLEASPGGWVRVFGRNIGRVEGKATLQLVAGGNKPITLAAESASLWDARFKVPDGVAVGKYQARLYNGQGDHRAWSSPTPIRIATPERWPKRRFNVRDYGARGDGKADDLAALNAAIDAAYQSGGGIVYLPRGRYLLSGALQLPRYITLKGERRDLVNLLWPDFATPPFALVQGSNHFRLEDLTLYASNYQHLIAGDLQSTSAGAPGHVRIARITARAVAYRGHLKPEEVDARLRQSLGSSTGGGDTLRLGGEHLEIIDNDLYGSGRALNLFHPQGAVVSGNHFYNGRWGWYSLSGVDKVIFEHNEITGADLMSTGGGINTLGGQIASQDIYFAHNTLSLMHGWDREAMTSDGPGGFYYGHVASQDGTRLTRLDLASTASALGEKQIGAGIFVLGGKGMGQYAQLAGFDGDHLVMDRKWSVLPDSSSIVTIVPMQQNYLIIDNTFTDAGMAVQFYGTSVNHLVAGNTSTRTGGFIASGRWYKHYQPSWYCQFLGNEITEGNIYGSGSNGAVSSGEAVIGIYGVQRAPNTAPLALGAVLRGNKLDSNAHITVDGGPDPKAPGVRDVLLQGNVIDGSDVGISVSPGVTGLWRDQTPSHKAQPRQH